MPFIRIELIEGRSLEQKRELVTKITKVVSETINVPPEVIHVIFEDLKKDQYAYAGKLVIDQ